jgi:hypothetical protein
MLKCVGLCQRRRGPIEILRPGDHVFFAPREEHWHGAARTRFMTHIAMLKVDHETNSATWGITSPTTITDPRQRCGELARVHEVTPGSHAVQRWGDPRATLRAWRARLLAAE